MKKLFFSLVTLFFFCTEVYAQPFTATVNRTELPEGETLMLSLELQDASTNATPDFSVLDKDFTLYSVSNAYRTNIVNGVSSRSRQWNLVLIPKRTGDVVIPSIKLDKWQTDALTIKVVKAGDTISPSNQQNQPRFKINAQVDTRNPYVQQQVNYTITIYDTGGLQGDAPSFLVSNEDEWIIKNLGEPQIINKVVDGRNLREITFNYALFPQKSGKLEIPAVKFNGFYLTRERRNDPFSQMFSDDMFIAGFGMADVFASRNPVVLTTEPLTIEVKPGPQEYKGQWWLPSSDVSLYGEFSPARPQFKVGEAVSRTIYLKAVGVIDSQLPEIRFAETKGVKQYPEKPETQMKVEQGKVISLEKITNVYIPTAEGEFELAPIEVNWFDIKTGQMQKASLPAMKVNVLPGESSTPVAVSPSPAQTAALPQQVSENAAAAAPFSNTAVIGLLLSAFALGIGVCALLMLLFRRRHYHDDTPVIHNYYRYVVTQAKARNLKAVRDGLLGWAAKRYGQEFTSLQQIANVNKISEFGCELEKLSEALYAQGTQDWNAASFIKAFTKADKQKVNKGTKDDILPKLYR